MNDRAAGPDARARLFVALELDPTTRAALAGWGEEVLSQHAALRAVPVDALHLTLCFLGTHALAEVDAIGDACAALAGAPPTGLKLGGALWLPRRRPRVLAVAVSDATGALATLQGALAGALAAGGWYQPQARPFLGHITIARVVSGERTRELQTPPALTIAPARVTLYRSHLSPQGARYEALRTVVLEGEPGARGQRGWVAAARTLEGGQGRAR